MFGNNLIKDRVMAVVKEKIDTAQKSYDEGVDKLKETSVKDIEAINTKLSVDEVALADKLVNDILIKII